MSTVDDIKDRLDIVDIVSGYVTLQKAGRNYKALCPFHQERTPSFVVFPDTQTWRCFGACGEGGDLFSFVMKAEGWDFSDALHELAKRAGVELEPPSPQQAARQEESERHHTLLDEAARFYTERLLKGDDAAFARDYVAGRHLTPDTIALFGLGYAPNDWREALHHLRVLGFSEEDIVETGIAIRNDKGNIYDRFRNRLMIPIRDGRGRTVGFGARALDPDDRAKYMNSPQGPLFDKSRLLYGLDMARRAIRETETVVVVEGYMDVMQAHQAGFTNVVAQMGTALTEEQLRQLEKYADRLILALDPDTAGVNATMRGLNVARQTLEGDEQVTFDPRGIMRLSGSLDMDIRVVTLPEGQDPDDLIHADPTAWQTMIAQAIPVATYVVQQGTAHLDANASYHDREAAARELLPILTATESDLQRSVNIQALARRVRIDERVLLQWTQRRQAAGTRAVPTVREQQKLAVRSSRKSSAGRVSGPPGQSEAREGFCLSLLLQQPDRLFAARRKLRELQNGDERLVGALAPLNAEDFVRADYQMIFRAIEEAIFQDDHDPHDYLTAHLSPELQPVVEDLRQLATLEDFERGLPRALSAELQSIVREQARINSLREPDTELFIQEALRLRHTRLEREARELFFLQQEADSRRDDLTYQQYAGTVSVNIRARGLIAKALQRLNGLARG